MSSSFGKCASFWERSPSIVAEKSWQNLTEVGSFPLSTLSPSGSISVSAGGFSSLELSLSSGFWLLYGRQIRIELATAAISFCVSKFSLNVSCADFLLSRQTGVCDLKLVCCGDSKLALRIKGLMAFCQSLAFTSSTTEGSTRSSETVFSCLLFFTCILVN